MSNPLSPDSRPLGLHFHDAELDPAALEADLLRRAADRHLPDRIWPRYGETIPTAGEPLSQVLAHHLEQLEKQLLGAAGPTIELAPSPATRWPVVGRLWGMIREQLHQLILFYVNKQAGEQAEINHHTLALLRGLAAENRRLQARIAVLEAQLNRREPDDGA